MRRQADFSSTIDAFLTRERLPEVFRHAATDVYAPLAKRIVAIAQASGSPLTIGLSGAQGSGKSTVALLLKTLLEAYGLKVAVLSIDDFYLTRAERVALGRRVHPLLQTRGVPGTHDIGWLLAVLQSLRGNGTTAIPRFDKGSDDRRAPDAWEQFIGPADIVILEGWCVGAAPQAESELIAPVNALEREFDAEGGWRRYVNTVLGGPYQRLFAMLNWLILLAAPDFTIVERWRGEQERRLRQRLVEQRGDVSRLMSASEVPHFVAHYERLTRHMLSEMPTRANAVISLDNERRPLHMSFNE